MHIYFPPNDVKIEGMENIFIPPMYLIRQNYSNFKISNLKAHIIQQLKKLDIDSFQGKRICITAGSRGIPHMPLIYRTVCDYLRELGASPFLVPAMGSHGNADAKGQLEVLASYGITEQSVNAPILSTMSVIQYGTLDGNLPLYCDEYAASADGIIIMHKVKPHTDFRAEHESGLAKMIAIGLANHKGASTFHKLGFEHFPQYLPQTAQTFIHRFPVIGAIGIVQNAYDEICAIEAAPGRDLLELDARLLQLAKERIPAFKFHDLDLLIIDRIGKEISGFGADPNVTGRTNGIQKDFSKILNLKRLFIADLTEDTHENGCGIGAADITTRRCLNHINWSTTWTNLITSNGIQGAKIPLYMNTDKEAILLAIRTCIGSDPSNMRIARIKNTLSLHDIQVSPALYQELKGRNDIELLAEAQPMEFDADGFLIPFKKAGENNLEKL